MTIAIIVAMDKELASINKVLTQPEEITVNGFKYHSGYYADKKLILYKCGIGKVNAAVGASVLIQTFKPDYLISSGVAGGIDKDVKVMDVVVSDLLVYHDAYTGEEGEGIDIVNPFNVDEALLNAAKEIQKENPCIKIGTICTGDQFITERNILESIKNKDPKGLAVDMESCAIAHTCKIFSTPFISFRIISDTIGAEQHVEEYKNFWNTLAENSFNILLKYLETIK